jgi:hypothetical protein
MRKIRVGSEFYECGKEYRGKIKIVAMAYRLGKAKTSRGTFISLDRLRSTKHYRPV